MDECGGSSWETAIQVTMLGEFSIQWGSRRIEWQSDRARRPWALLEYLLANRQTAVSPDRLYDALWEDGETENPSNALKNLVYRVRGILEPLSGGRCELIIFRNGRYSWNNSVPCVVDAEEFEKAFHLARKPGTSDSQRIMLYRRAVELYRGEFLASANSVDWVIRMAARYQSMYAACVTDLAALLLSRQECQESILLCVKAVEIDPFQESVQEMLIRSYLMAGERARALDHYHYISGAIVEKLGVSLTDGFRLRIDSLLQQYGPAEDNIDDLAGELAEREDKAAYYCSYGVFREICRLETRLSERRDRVVFLSLLTFRAEGKNPDSPLVQDAMTDLLEVLLHSLRRGDAVTRITASQFLLMLIVPDAAAARVAVGRIMERFAGLRRHPGIRLISRVRRLSPVPEKDSTSRMG